jgi:dnd system-associated protein 4
MATVFFDKQFAHFVKTLCDDKDERTSKAIFENMYDFMIFASMVGKHFNDDVNDIKVEQSNRGIPSRIFKGNHKQGMAYLLALESEKSVNILKDKDDTDNQRWKYIERYAFLGCEEISQWFADRAQDEPLDIFLDKMREIASSNIELEEAEVSNHSSQSGGKDIKF